MGEENGGRLRDMRGGGVVRRGGVGRRDGVEDDTHSVLLALCCVALSRLSYVSWR